MKIHYFFNCNYILGRLAAALQNVFVFGTLLPPFFSECCTMTKIHFHANITINEKEYLFYYYHISNLPWRVQEGEGAGDGAGFYSVECVAF